MCNSCSTNNPEASKVLKGTTWVVTRVDIGNSSQILADTISFISENKYFFNANTYNYNIGNYNSEPNYYLLCEDCPSFGDDVEAWLNPAIINQGVFNGVEFKKRATNSTILVWMHKI